MEAQRSLSQPSGKHTGRELFRVTQFEKKSHLYPGRSLREREEEGVAIEIGTKEAEALC